MGAAYFVPKDSDEYIHVLTILKQNGIYWHGNSDYTPKAVYNEYGVYRIIMRDVEQGEELCGLGVTTRFDANDYSLLKSRYPMTIPEFLSACGCSISGNYITNTDL